MSIMSEYQTDSVSGINYATIRSSGKKPKLEGEEAKEMYALTHDNRIKNFKTKKDIIKESKKIKVDKRILPFLVGIGVGIGSIAVTQTIGTNKIVTAMAEDVTRDDIYITPTNGRITYKSNHQYVEDEQKFLKDWLEDLYEQGWTPDQAAIAISEIYGINNDRLPSIEGYKDSTFLGRLDERNEAFKTGKTQNAKKGVSK